MTAILLGLARVAGADATVPSAPTANDPLGCPIANGPMWQALHSGLNEKARVAAGGGLLTSIGRNHLIVATSWEKRTVVLPASLVARVATLEGTFAPVLVEDEGGALVGLLATAARRDKFGKVLRLIAPNGRPLWTSSEVLASDNSMLAPDNAMVALAAGELIVVVASFDRFAAGARLFALDKNTGKRRWSIDLGLMSWTDVTLALDSGRVVLRGYDAGDCYIQTFDLATGKPLSSPRWKYAVSDR